MKPYSVRSRPRKRDLRHPATVLSQPKISSMRFRIRWLMSYDHADEKTGEQVAVFDLVWPNGIQGSGPDEGRPAGERFDISEALPFGRENALFSSQVSAESGGSCGDGF